MDTIVLPDYLTPSKVLLTIPNYKVNNTFDGNNNLKPFRRNSLSNIAIGGGLRLLFDNQPIRLIIPEKCNNIFTYNSGGYCELYRWYIDDLKSGHISFEIPDDHIIWRLCSYRDQFKNFTKKTPGLPDENTKFKAKKLTPPTFSGYNKIASWEFSLVSEVF